MWSESQRTALAQISEDDKIAATAVPWRYLTGPAQVILETPEKQASGWQWQAAVGLGAWFYRRRRVPAATVLAQLDRVMTGLENEARSASLDRTVPIDQWALRMAGISETSALVAGAFAAGGWARLDVVLVGRLHQADQFAAQVTGTLEAAAEEQRLEPGVEILYGPIPLRPALGDEDGCDGQIQAQADHAGQIAG